MRRALRKLLPAFSHYFHLAPWQVGGGPACLTFDEIEEYRRQLPKAPKPHKTRRRRE